MRSSSSINIKNKIKLLKKEIENKKIDVYYYFPLAWGLSSYSIWKLIDKLADKNISDINKTKYSVANGALISFFLLAYLNDNYILKDKTDLKNKLIRENKTRTINKSRRSRKRK